MKIGKPYKNYSNDLETCLTYFEIFFNMHNFITLFIGLLNLLSYFNLLLGKKVRKLLESYYKALKWDLVVF